MNAHLGTAFARVKTISDTENRAPGFGQRAWNTATSSDNAEGAPAGGFTLIELLVGIAIMGVLAGLLLPTLNRAKAKAQNAACLSQLRQLGTATRLYTDDNDNILPSAELLPTMPIDPAAPLPRICDVLGPLLGTGNSNSNNAVTVFKCPADNLGRFAAEGSSYQWNTSLNGHRMDETTSTEGKFVIVEIGPGGTTQTNGTFRLLFEPTTTPLFVDYDEFHPRSPQPGRNVVFMDNHAGPFVPPPISLSQP